MSVEVPRLRVAVVGIVVVSLFAALFARLYYLQILSETTLEAVRGGPEYREVATQGPRGRILDREGRVLVDNRESINVTIDRRQFEAVKDQDALVLRLARVLNSHGVATKVSDIRNRLADLRYDQFKPVPIAEDVSADLEGYLLERLFEFPSVDVARAQVRTYPYGSTAAHVLGYTGPISGDELDDVAKDFPKPYEPGDDIGKAGVETVFENELRATPGTREIEVDPRNVEIGTRSNTDAKPGEDLQLTIDLDLQRSVEASLAQALSDARQQRKTRPDQPDFRAPAGAVVVLDAKTSEVVAMASYPTYNPSEFIGGISQFRFSELNDPASFFPFTNRAVQSTYSPGSTFKPFTAVASLQDGLQSADTVIKDRGSYELDNCTENCVFQNANRTAYGDVDLRKALVVSSDVYFFRLGEQFWVRQAEFGKTAIQDVARRFGLGSPTWVQLPEEDEGLISDPDFKKQRNQDNPEVFPYGEWFTGDNVNLAIGQGDVQVTPLQLANAYAALANGGQLTAPSVAKAMLDHDSGATVRSFEPRVLGHVDLPDAVRQPIIDGLEGAVDDPSGTAYEAFRGFPTRQFEVAGKTGTAEVGGVPPRADTSIFASFGPVQDPRYVVVAFMEESGFAANTAAPLARKVYEQLDQVKPLIPTTTAPAATTPTTSAPASTQDDTAASEVASDEELAAPPPATTAAETTTTATTPAPTTTAVITATTAPPPPTQPTAAAGPATTEAAVAPKPARPAAAPTTTAGGP